MAFTGNIFLELLVELGIVILTGIYLGRRIDHNRRWKKQGGYPEAKPTAISNLILTFVIIIFAANLIGFIGTIIMLFQ